MNIDEAYDAWATCYDSNQNNTRDLDGRVCRELLAGRSFKHGFEAGCGTGKNTTFLKTICQSVLAVDFSSGMLEKARKRFETKPAVRFERADLQEPWPTRSGSHDLVCCNLVLEHFPDLEPFFSEAARVLEPGGLLLLSELHPFRQYLGKQAHFEHDGKTVAVKAFGHQISEFLDAASLAGFDLLRLAEWWHEEDEGKAPRLLSLLLEKPCHQPGMG